MPLGYSDLKNVMSLYANWDLSYLQQWQTMDRVTFDQVVSRIGSALVLFNRSLTSGYLSSFIRTTTEMTMEYDTGGDSSELSPVTEYGQPDPIFGEGTGHMIPMADYGGALGWTYMALKRMRMEQYNRDIRRLIDRARNTWEKKILTRMFKSTYDAVGTGKSVPFADGGVADSTYAPLPYDGQVFSTSHNHYFRESDDAAGRLAAVKEMVTTLIEHGMSSPFDLLIPAADAADWASVTGFVKPEKAFLSTVSETRAAVDPTMYTGVIEVPNGWVRVKTINRLPTNYAGLFKPMGYNAVDNPLVVRYEAGAPLGLSLVATPVQFPLQDAIAYFTFGVGVNNRVAGACAYFAASGSYTSPTIS